MLDFDNDFFFYCGLQRYRNYNEESMRVPIINTHNIRI